jgi:hypothetical protein
LIDRLAVATRGKFEMTTSAVYAWESGKNLLQDEVACEIAPILGCKAEDLIGTSDDAMLERAPLTLVSQNSRTVSEQDETLHEWVVELTLQRVASDDGLLRAREYSASCVAVVQRQVSPCDSTPHSSHCKIAALGPALATTPRHS